MATNLGWPARSPRALRISLTQTLSTASPTTVPGQTASSRSSLVTSCPARSARHRSTAKDLGVRRMVLLPRQRQALPASRRNGAKRTWRASLNPLPLSYRSLTNFLAIGWRSAGNFLSDANEHLVHATDYINARTHGRGPAGGRADRLSPRHASSSAAARVHSPSKAAARFLGTRRPAGISAPVSRLSADAPKDRARPMERGRLPKPYCSFMTSQRRRGRLSAISEPIAGGASGWRRGERAGAPGHHT